MILLSNALAIVGLCLLVAAAASTSVELGLATAGLCSIILSRLLAE